MKNLLLSCALGALLPLAASAQDKTLVKTISPGDATEILVDFRYKDMVADAWDKTDLRLVIEIHANMPEAIMDQLVKVGRYNISTVTENGVLKIQAPNMDKTVTIKGVDLDDQIYVHVNTPSNFIRKDNRIYKDMAMIVALIEQGGGRLGDDAKAQMRKIGKNINVEYKLVCPVTPQEFERMVNAKNGTPTTNAGKKNNNTSKITGETSMGAPGSGDPSGKPAGTKATLKELDIRKGDILIGGEPIGIE